MLFYPLTRPISAPDDNAEIIMCSISRAAYLSAHSLRKQGVMDSNHPQGASFMATDFGPIRS